MILLDATTKSLQIVLDGSVTTSQLAFNASFSEVSQSNFAVTAISSTDGATNNTTAVTLVSAPGASRSRKVAYIAIYNADSASATVTVRLNNNGTMRNIVSITLAVGDTLEYRDGSGWQVIDAQGQIQVTAPALVHTLLDGTLHSDTATQTATRGSLIYGNSTPKWDELVIGAANRVLRSDGTDVAWGQVVLTTDVSGDLPFANLAQIAALSVLGVTGNSTADVAAITAGTDHQVLRRSGTALTFGAVNLASSDAVTGDLPYANLTPSANASKLLGRGDASAGDWQEITLGTGLTMTGTTLSASGGGTVDISGTPVDNQLAIWTDANTIEGVAAITYDGSNLSLTTNLILDDNSGNSPTLSWIGGTNNDTFTMFVDDEAGAGTSLLVIRLPDAAGASALVIEDSATSNKASIDSDGNAQFDGTLDVDGDITVGGGDIICSANTVIRRNTSDGSDSGYVRLSGGGAANDITRGADLRISGNEDAGPGSITAKLGNVSGSEFSLQGAAGTTVFNVLGADGSATFTSSQLVDTYKFNATDTTNNANWAVGIQLGVAAATANRKFISFRAAAGVTEVGSVSISTSAVAYNTASDERLKTFLGPSRYGLNAILAIDLRDYYWNNDEAQTLRTGVSAQQLFGVYPEAVKVGGDDPDKEPWAVDYSKLTPPIIKAIQELAAKIAALENKSQ